MIRENDLPCSMFALVDICPDGQAELILRRATGGNVETEPVWQGV
jgi:hypothetical protein